MRPVAQRPGDQAVAAELDFQTPDPRRGRALSRCRAGSRRNGDGGGGRGEIHRLEQTGKLHAAYGDGPDGCVQSSRDQSAPQGFVPARWGERETRASPGYGAAGGGAAHTAAPDRTVFKRRNETSRSSKA